MQKFDNRNNADERLAAWKILLPLDPTSRVIALGVDSAVRDSLCHSYANISGSLDNPVGAIVVIGSFRRDLCATNGNGFLPPPIIWFLMMRWRCF